MSLPGYQSPFERTPGLRRSLPAFDRISVVVPFYNEEECAEFVLREIVTCHPGAEVIAIDDGSKDRTWEILCSVPGVTPLRLTQNRGQSGALFAGCTNKEQGNAANSQATQSANEQAAPIWLEVK